MISEAGSSVRNGKAVGAVNYRKGAGMRPTSTPWLLSNLLHSQPGASDHHYLSLITEIMFTRPRMSTALPRRVLQVFGSTIYLCSS